MAGQGTGGPPPPADLLQRLGVGQGNTTGTGQYRSQRIGEVPSTVFAFDPSAHEWRGTATSGSRTLPLLQGNTGANVTASDQNPGPDNNRDYPHPFHTEQFRQYQLLQDLNNTVQRSQVLDAYAAATQGKEEQNRITREHDNLTGHLGTAEVARREHLRTITAEGEKLLGEQITYAQQPPTWVEADFTGVNVPKEVSDYRVWKQTQHPRCDEFIREDSQGQREELAVDIGVIQAKVAWLNGNYTAMEDFVNQAQASAEGVNFPALLAKLSFYRAISFVGRGDCATAAQHFDDAEPVDDVFRECALLGSYRAWAREIEAGKQTWPFDSLPGSRATSVVSGSGGGGGGGGGSGGGSGSSSGSGSGSGSRAGDGGIPIATTD